jgi:glycine/D-amino acid oxidase-like deaminating enzyme
MPPVTKYGRSPWVEQFPRSRVPSYPRYRGKTQSDVVIVGGGFTGCATAYAFSAAGVKVVLLEADRIGRGATGAASGWIATDPGVPFAQLEKAVGLRAARRAWQAWRRAALDLAALLRRLDIKCSLETQAGVLVARAPEESARLKREQKARVDAGFEAPLLKARTIRSDFGLDGVVGLRAKDGGTIDPYRACVGLASAAVSRGAQLFERSPVRRVTFTRKTADVHLSDGVIRTKRVVVTTSVPTALVRGLIRHFWFKTCSLVLTEAIPAKIRRQLGSEPAIVRDLAGPPHVIRWVGEDRLLVAGADSETVPPRQRDKVVVQRTGQLMYELSTLYPDISGIRPEYGWMADYALTAEGIPYIGPHRNYPHHLFAFGDASHSVTGAYLASRVLLRQHLDDAESADDAFSFNR